ncbi:MvaI/BcnI family restriction endonuclease [Streptococcus sanguinis]|uniref:LlaMI restriction endonuclease superfamily protein n=1 Tax=Streptococcus sanguinis SK1056 TaxID=888820 RepID=F3UD96_STRSA|nr:MvaI/BcnI family restriction endonuclease [Streptococcus sanguinis]EGJ37722.1 LlaMI restriction endonuclease superfamily protein [Streptococcus sanguinis SK1056]MCC3168266.1 llaMI restriction endonuclease superfamily protein [Streptococcus sanguinis]
MQFIPYDDELEVINNLHKYNSNDYTVIRLTQTMLNKSIIDANGFLRTLLLDNDLLDFRNLTDKVYLTANLVLGNQKHEVKISFYKANKRGDERFWIYGLGKFIKSSQINVNDLIYITVDNQKELTLFNVTHSIPQNSTIIELFGQDKVEDSLNRLIPQIRAIARQGFHSNSKGAGKIAPKDAGDTLESLLGIKTNNSQEADFEGIIELKSKSSKTLDTLFTLRPNFEGTPVAEFESNDRSRVSAFARLYGYNSDKHSGYKSLYITIGSEENPQNNQGFYLEVNDRDNLVELRKQENNKSILTAFWTFKALEEELQKKHPATLWVKVESEMDGETAQFKYVEAELTRSPQFMTFLSLIKSGAITYDWRGYTTPSGKYAGKNHGNAWRIKNKQRNLLFGSTEKIKLED